MKQNKTTPDDNFESRLSKARRRYIPVPSDDQSMESGLGRALMIGIEFFSAVAIAALLGTAFDHYFDTAPFGLIVFFFFGIGAAFLNIYRFVRNMDYDTDNNSGNNESTSLDSSSPSPDDKV